ncbi:hypothetical protein KJ953_02300 [Patescibacteria group bacterium]|nr:hypothetical protein [Patescibacteria group bacterium]
MGYAGKLELKKEAIRLRKRGFSYSEIRKKVCVSKSTLSLWCRDVAIENKFIGAIWIHDDLNVEIAKRFWSKLTGIPEYQFHKTYIAELKKDSNKIRKKHHKYGVFKIRVCDVNLQRKIRGWMAGILGVKEVKYLMLLNK